MSARGLSPDGRLQDDDEEDEDDEDEFDEEDDEDEEDEEDEDDTETWQVRAGRLTSGSLLTWGSELPRLAPFSSSTELIALQPDPRFDGQTFADARTG
jgi:hypothetical protein